MCMKQKQALLIVNLFYDACVFEQPTSQLLLVSLLASYDTDNS